MPMHHYDSQGSTGIIPARDQNAAAPGDPAAASGDPMARPEFIQDALARLAVVRTELSRIMVQEMNINSRFSYGTTPTPAQKASDIEAQLTRSEQRQKLEVEESALTQYVNDFLYVASLRQTPEISDKNAAEDAQDRAALLAEAAGKQAK